MKGAKEKVEKILLKERSGITLIALVITIIVLLILAGVAIASITGEGGILNRAQQAREAHQKAEAEEQIKLKLDEWKIEKEQNPDSILEEFLKDRFGEDNVSKNSDNTFSVIQNGYEGIVDQDGNLIGEIQKVGPRPKIENIKITTNGSTVPADYSLEEGTPVQINFTASMEGGEVTNIEPQLPYTTNGTEMEVTFKVTGQVNGETYVTNRTISVKSKYEDLVGAKVNPPKVSQGMIPIKWNGNKWEVCEQDDPEWYRYVDQLPGRDGKSKWANIMLSDGTYKYDTVKVGQEVEENQLGSMYVWIPRYAYSITSGYNTSTEGDIKIAFLEGKKAYSVGTSIEYKYQGETGIGNITNETGQGNWNEHPAFIFGENIVSGIWVAKFESGNENCTNDVTTGETEYQSQPIKIQPNKTSWRNLTISNMFDVCREMQTKYSTIYEISSDSNKVDTHMMKNSEWGAVAYLTHSSYGRNKYEVSTNTSDTFLTGGGNYESNTNQSTTGNVTGIYDLVGGNYECVSAFVSWSKNLNTYGKSIIDGEVKYMDIYSGGGAKYTSVANCNSNRNIYGDGLYETRQTSNVGSGNASWFDDMSGFPSDTYPFFTRGGYSLNMGSVGYPGIFCTETHDGKPANYLGFRSILVHLT